MKDKIDDQIIAKLCVEITVIFKKIVDEVPLNKQSLLKNLAASSIHLALFMEDILNNILNKEKTLNIGEKEFLETCGCKDIDKTIN